jgi:hypothetical protein
MGKGEGTGIMEAKAESKVGRNMEWGGWGVVAKEEEREVVRELGWALGKKLGFMLEAKKDGNWMGTRSKKRKYSSKGIGMEVGK